MAKKEKGNLLLALLVFIIFIFVISIAAYLAYQESLTKKPVSCTADAKVCPDGSAVGRIPPNCDFTSCP
jgi:hypothetical protein